MRLSKLLQLNHKDHKIHPLDCSVSVCDGILSKKMVH